MLWIEPCEMLYASIFGGLIGAVSMAIAYRKTQKENWARMEHFWSEDVLTLRRKIDDVDKRCQCRTEEVLITLSTNSVDKPVTNVPNHKHNKTHKGKQWFNHGEQKK